MAQWDESIVLEYEARVEPFTAMFVQGMLDPFFAEARETQQDSFGTTSPPSLLDVGCGSGVGSLLAAKQGLRVVATDVSKGMVDRVRQRAKEWNVESSIECLVADGQNLSTALLSSSSSSSSNNNIKFDYAIAAFSLIFFPDPAKGLSEIYHCLSDNGGKFCLSAWGNADETPAFQIFREAFQAIKPDATDAAKPNRMTGSPSTLQALLVDAGFQDVNIVGPIMHYVQVSSSEEYYKRFALTNPDTKKSLEALSETDRQAIREKVMELAETRGGGHADGSISLPSKAYFAYGTKRIS